MTIKIINLKNVRIEKTYDNSLLFHIDDKENKLTKSDKKILECLKKGKAELIFNKKTKEFTLKIENE